MLKHLFTSKAREKLLTIFLLNEDTEFFVRELTRKVDEQINSVRRELDNLKQLGLLKSRMRNRKKFFFINKHFILFNDLKNIIKKSQHANNSLIKKIANFGEIDLLVMSGSFVEKESPVDLLIVGTMDKEALGHFLDTDEVNVKKPIKFSILTRDDFLYRWKCKDKFITEILEDSSNIIGINKLEKEIEGEGKE